VVLAAIGLAGCGASHSSLAPPSTAAATSSGSEASYRAQVNAICAVFNKQMERLGPEHAGGHRLRQQRP
jgi:hypothetical protein